MLCHGKKERKKVHKIVIKKYMLIINSLQVNDNMSRTLSFLVRICMAPIRFPANVGTFLYAAMIRSTLGANPASNAISTGG
jgi:hypothetical protein